jgi:hypothetical protein
MLTPAAISRDLHFPPRRLYDTLWRAVFTSFDCFPLESSTTSEVDR